MAQSKIISIIGAELKSLKAKSFNSRINSAIRKVSFINPKTKTRSVRGKHYPVVRVARQDHSAKIRETLPFRIKFTNIGIEGYGPNNPPGIGLAVIGFNNYIL
jgi:hypothetical protein